MVIRKLVICCTVIFLSSFSSSALADPEGHSASVYDTWNQGNYEGGLQVGEIWFTHVPGLPGGSLSAFPYAYGDAGRYWHVAGPWAMGLKFGVGFALNNFNPLTAWNSSFFWENRFALPIEGPDLYDRTRYLYIGLDPGFSFTSLNFNAPLPPGVLIGENPQTVSWASPTLRLSLSAYYMELAYQLILPVNSGQPTGSVLTFGLRLMLN